MGLGRQWEERLKIWDRAFAPNLYRKIGAVRLEGFATMEHISREQAKQGSFLPFEEGALWGRKWEYGWFRCHIVLPGEAWGQRVLLHLGIAPEMLVYVNGREAGSIDREHEYVQLTPAAAAGEQFEIYAEAYAGHGPRPEGGGICPGEAIPVPEPPKFQCVVSESSFGVWNEEMFQAYADYHTLYELWRVLPENSLRGMQVAQGLKEFTYQADFELPEPLRTESVSRARKVLAPLLQANNGASAPLFSVFGQSHLDLAWLWTNAETKRKSARTYANQVALMERYPEYRFLLCEPPILENLKNYYPDLYRRVKEKVRQGNFIPDGAVWVEGDTNMAGGESLIRQFVYGKRWFKEEFGTDSQVAWMPDTFGYSGALPQIMKGCGVDYFATQKLLRADPESEPFPYNLFWWEGIDGSRVLSHIFKKNNTEFSPADMVQRWEEDRNQKEGISGMLYPFGYGDGGGGPTELMVEIMRRCGDLEGAPRTKIEGPQEYFKRASGQRVENVYYGELYLAWHRGTYTAQAQIKRKVRQAENALRQAEFLAGLLRLSGGAWQEGQADSVSGGAWQEGQADSVPDGAWKEGQIGSVPDGAWQDGRQAAARLTALWKELLFCEFHDILPGTSIRRVNEEAEEALDAVRREALSMADAFLTALTGGEAIFNSLSWPRAYKGICIPPCGYIRLSGDESPAEAAQNAAAERPSGIAQSGAKEDVAEAARGSRGADVRVESADADGAVQTATVETPYYCARVDCLGRITSLRDKKSGYEYAAGALNELCMYRDVNIAYDAWEIGSMYEQVPVLNVKGAQDLREGSVCDPFHTEVCAEGANFQNERSSFRFAAPEENGRSMTGNVKGAQGMGQAFVCDPANGTLKARREVDGVHLDIFRAEAHFTWQQEIVFAADGRRIEFRTRVNWRERHKLLKVAFPTTVHTREAVEEIQFGYLKRPTHKSRRYERDLYETCHHRYAVLSDGKNGLAVLNDCKYGISAKDSTLALTLLRAPVIPDMEADQGEHEFTYALYLFDGPFTESGVVREAYELNVPLTAVGAPAATVRIPATAGDIPVTAAGSSVNEPENCSNLKDVSSFTNRTQSDLLFCAASANVFRIRCSQKSGRSMTGRERVSYFSVDRENIILETCKPAMDEENGAVLRLYECMGGAVRCRLSLPCTVKRVWRCNMLEEKQEELPVVGGVVELTFRSFEIKTLLLTV